ncbi:MAG TPA: response regulator [Opitutus sp.]|nr:response regulator [Opitutus sp.]
MTEPSNAPSILVVDDDEGLLILMAETLRGEGYAVRTADSGAAALARLREGKPDLMLLDLKLKDTGGPELLARLRQEEHAVPFIVVTGQGDERVAVEVMKQGALDYVMKDGALLDLLPAVVRRGITATERERALADAEREQRRLEKEILEVSEREQRRIGEDLHDGLGQQLTAIEMLCTSLKADVVRRAPELRKQVNRIGEMLREAVAHTRSMAHGLVPVKDEPDALWASLVELAERTTSAGRAKCRVDCPEPVLVADNAVAGHLYRIAQEAVNNALKHSGAREVVIRLARSKEALELKITDNGKGLARSKGGGIGLEVMQHRAAVIGGELRVESKPGKGVAITCTLPAKP